MWLMDISGKVRMYSKPTSDLKTFHGVIESLCGVEKSKSDEYSGDSLKQIFVDL